MCAPPLDRNRAALPFGGDVHKDQHALAVDVEEPLRLELQRATPGQRVRIVAHGFESANDRPIRVDGREVELGVGCNQPGSGCLLNPRRGQAKLGERTAHELTFSCDIARAVSRAGGKVADAESLAPLTAEWLAVKKTPPRKERRMHTDEMVEILEGLIRDPDTNPTAKCTAIRTLMRIKDETSVELDNELSRLLRDDD